MKLGRVGCGGWLVREGLVIGWCGVVVGGWLVRVSEWVVWVWVVWVWVRG